MIIYEVNLEIDKHIYDEFATWLRAHINEMCTLPGFINACLYEHKQETQLPKDALDNAYHHLVVHYQIDRQANLDHYLQNEAPRMREKAMSQFGDNFRAKRRVLLKRKITA